MQIRKIIFFIIIIILISLLTFFIKNNYNSSKKGNNISNKSADEIEEYILNIDSYYAIAQVTVQSNKSSNTYKLKQEYIKNQNMYMQEVIEPEYIAGVKFIYNEGILKIENTNLSLSKLYEEYKYIESNVLSLNSFIEDYANSEEKKCYEENRKNNI